MRDLSQETTYKALVTRSTPNKARSWTWAVSAVGEALGFALLLLLYDVGLTRTLLALSIYAATQWGLGAYRPGSSSCASVRSAAALLGVGCALGPIAGFGTIWLVLPVGVVLQRALIRRMLQSIAVPVTIRGRSPRTLEAFESIRALNAPCHRVVSTPDLRTGWGRSAPVHGLELDLRRGKGVAEALDSLALKPLEGPGEGMSRRVKYIFDAAIALIVLAGSAPFLLLLLVLLALRGGRPLFYRQERLTLGEKPFDIIKFRTMPANAEASGPVWPMGDDERATATGRWLRRFWIDELPQLINVIRGELSLVGPRPERPAFAQEFARYLPRYKERYRALGGLTGWAQVHGFAGNTSIRGRLRHDLIYIRRWSLVLDLRVLLLTLCLFANRREQVRYAYRPGCGEPPP